MITKCKYEKYIYSKASWESHFTLLLNCSMKVLRLWSNIKAIQNIKRTGLKASENYDINKILGVKIQEKKKGSKSYTSQEAIIDSKIRE